MTLKKESEEVDLVVESRPLTPEEENLISAFIRADKAKRAKKNKVSKSKAAGKKTKK